MILVIEVFPMAGDTLAETRKEVTGLDVLVRPDGGDPIEEWENLTFAVAKSVVKQMALKYPEAEENWDLVEMLK